MKIRQIRNVTLCIDFDGKRFLIDPWLQEKGSVPPIGNANTVPNPTVPLPLPIKDIIEGIDAYIVTHIHFDHFDLDYDENGEETGGKCLEKGRIMFVQNEDDRLFMERSGFVKTKILPESGTIFEGMELIKTAGVHGTIDPAGPVMGIIMRAPEEPTLYIAGDTIYCKEVEQVLFQYRPAVIVTNACAAYLPETGRLIMNGEDLLKIHNALPQSHIIASHMEAVNHATITRSELSDQMRAAGIAEYVTIPKDGEACVF